MTSLTLSILAFVGTHFALSHPLRAPLVARIGAGGFLGLYSLIAFATLGWVAHAYRRVSVQPFLWEVGDGLWTTATVLMLLASILFVGSLIGNPALPGPPQAARAVPAPAGVFAITRHPMMWSFALWAAVHMLIFPMAAQLVLAGGILILSLVGAGLQDAKKCRLQPAFWSEWSARTSYLPFGALIQGRLQWSAAALQPHAWAGGVVLWLAATWAHVPLAGWTAGVWRWLA